MAEREMLRWLQVARVEAAAAAECEACCVAMWVKLIVGSEMEWKLVRETSVRGRMHLETVTTAAVLFEIHRSTKHTHTHKHFN